jgi:hypothetical protein
VSARDNFVDIDVVTNCAWTPSGVPSWIQLDPASGGSGTTRVRVRINASNSPNPRTAEIVFRVEAAQTSLVINQEAAEQPRTYTGSAGSVTVQYSNGSGDGDNGVCQYTTTISDFSASITLFEESATAGQITLTANETANRFCTSPLPIGQSQHSYTLSQGSIRNNALDARFSAAGSNRPQASLQLTGTRNGGAIDATITLSRTDSSGALNWRVTQRIVLNQR